MTRGDRRLQHVWTAGTAEAFGPRERIEAALDENAIPPSTVLLVERDRIACGVITKLAAKKK